MTITRRSLLKLATGSAVSYLAPLLLGNSVFAQTTKAVGKEVVAAPAASTLPLKLDGTVSYNAGWVINLEDRTELLEVEAKKTKLQEENKAQKKPDQPIKTEGPITTSASAPIAVLKEPSKDWSTRWNKWVGKVKEWF